MNQQAQLNEAPDTEVVSERKQQAQSVIAASANTVIASQFLPGIDSNEAGR